MEGNKAGIVTGIQGMLGNRPGVKVDVVSVKGLGGGDTTELVLRVTEQQGAASRRVPASELHSFLQVGRWGGVWVWSSVD